MGERERQAGRFRGEMFSGPCRLFLARPAALRATAAPCRCHEGIAALRIGPLIWRRPHTARWPKSDTALQTAAAPE